MGLSKKMIAVVVATASILASLFYFYLLPAAKTVYVDVKEYETQVAYRDDYTNFTTPLSKDVIDDVCTKLNIQRGSKNCLPGAVVYGPDFFDEIKAYFNNLPEDKKTYEHVEQILGKYQIVCIKVNSKGEYSCDYDLRGDKRYRIAFFFYENGFYYRIMANKGGS